MFQDLQTHLLYFKTIKECHSSRWTQFYCMGKYLFSKLPIHWSETRYYVSTALESAIMNVRNIQEGKDLNYVPVLVYAVDVNLIAKNSSNLQINKNTEIITYNNKVDWGGEGRTNMQDSLLEYMTVPSQNVIILKSLNTFLKENLKASSKLGDKGTDERAY